MQTVTKEQYINNPCRSLPNAYWKSLEHPIPPNIKIFHESNYDGSSNATKYFRLVHDLHEIETPVIKDYTLQKISIKTQKELVARILSECYNTEYTVEFIDRLTKTRVFDNDLWLLVIEKSTKRAVALGIADFDAEIMEGSLEWIQVLSDKRGLGLGKLVVNELLMRLKNKANFVTVSGQVDNETAPEFLYRKCGFTGNDIWYVVRS